MQREGNPVRRLTMHDITWAAKQVAAQLIGKISREPSNYFLYGIPRGGIPAALAIAGAGGFAITDDPVAAHIYVDDLVDSGETRRKRVPNGVPFAALFTKRNHVEPIDYIFGETLHKDAWAVFPWEGSEIASGEDIVTRFLSFIGEDPTRGGLKETPARVLKAWREEWFSGYKKDPTEILKTFEDGAEKYDEMIVVKGIPIYTHCEHHLAPFFGEAVVGYIPNGKIVGLSKLVRLADIFARRLQVQERLTSQIADALMDVLGAKGAGVILKCRHLCMESRGIQKPGTETITSVMRGAMFEQASARSELLSLVK